MEHHHNVLHWGTSWQNVLTIIGGTLMVMLNFNDHGLFEDFECFTVELHLVAWDILIMIGLRNCMFEIQLSCFSRLEDILSKEVKIPKSSVIFSKNLGDS